MRTRLQHALLAACLWSTSASAQSLTTQIRSQIDTYENAVRANTQKIINAATDEEKAHFRTTIPSPAPQAASVLALVQANLDDPEAVTGVTWLVTQCFNLPEGQTALQQLATHFADRPEIDQAVKQMEFYPAEAVATTLQTVLEKNTHPSVRAAAAFTLGKHAFRTFEAAPDDTTRQTAREQAERHFQTVVTDYPEVTVNGFKMADQAAAMLFEITNLSPGATAPEITGSDPDGTAFSLSDYRGKHILVVFWGQWCHGCHGIMPLLADLGTRYQNRPFAILGINTDDPATARTALASNPVPWRVWLDGSTSGPITSEWNLHHFPTLYLIDPNGTILAKNPSLQHVSQILDALP